MKLTNLTIGASLALSALVAPAFAASVPNQLIVEFKAREPGAAFRELHRLNVNGAMGNLGTMQFVSSVRAGLHVVRFPTGLSAKAAAAVLSRDPGVRYAQPNFILKLLDQEPAPQAFPTARTAFASVLTNALGDQIMFADPEIQDPPNLPNPPITDPSLAEAWGLKTIKFEEAFAAHTPKAEIIVADIDTGVDYTHEDLINNMWRNPSPTQNDRVGYDFANNDAFPYDDQGHGTHTSGTIAAVRNNGKGFTGVAPNAKIMALKFITQEGSGTTADAVKAIDYAVANGARVLSNSWGGYEDSEEGDNQALYDAIKRAGDKDVLFVAAAGNDNNDNDKRKIIPGAYNLPNILAVAATNEQDRKSFFSNYGLTTTHVAAPGSGIYSSIPGNAYMKNSGTSMACPHVAGLAALILAERPELKSSEVKEIIMATVDRLAALEGKIATGGRVNAEAALRKAKSFGF